MTAREWVPGDVALVEAGCWANRKVALRLAEGWAHTNGVNVDGDGVIDAVRPLVVVDPEDAEQVARITQAILDAIPLVAADIPMKEGRAAYWYEALPLAVDAALRNLTESPRPPEVYLHFSEAMARGVGAGTTLALCGKVWKPSDDVTVVGRCPECAAVVDAGWVA